MPDSKNMSDSKYIAGLMGPVLLAVGASMLLNAGLFPAMASQLASNYGLVFIAGMIALVAGIAIVRVHNIWEPSWRVVVTIFGWLAIVGGVTRMLLPDRAAAIAGTVAESGAIPIAGAVALALGALLTFKGYLSEG